MLIDPDSYGDIRHPRRRGLGSGADRTGVDNQYGERLPGAYDSPAWNTWATPASFFTTALLLGGLVVGSTLVVNHALTTVEGTNAPPELLRGELQWIALSAIVLLGMQLVVILLWVTGLAAGRGAALRAAARVAQEHRLILRLRLALAVVGIAVAGVAVSRWGEGTGAGVTIILAFGLALASEVLGRLLFCEARVRHGV